MTEIEIATRFISKDGYAKEKGYEFTLTFAQYKRILTTKKCKYTGIELTNEPDNKGLKTQNFCTLDRVDNMLGYIPGNVVACSYAYNQIKAIIENPLNVIGFDEMAKAVAVQKQLQKKTNALKAAVIDERNKSARTSHNFKVIKSSK